MKKLFVLMIAALLALCATGCVWFDTYIFNRIDYVNEKIDDATNYDKIKTVEDTCRAMIASYESDRMTYEQYRDSDNEDERSWASQAMMRANKTASTYNNYILNNSFVWSGNVPDDIRNELEYIGS